MRAEHITVLGTSVVRDSKDIALTTVNALKEFQVGKGTHFLKFPFTNLDVKITSTQEGAIFDILKSENILYTTLCCFDNDYTGTIFELTKSLTLSFPRLRTTVIRKPIEPLFLYSVPVLPLFATQDEAMICGEVEFYIYYSLYLSNKK